MVKQQHRSLSPNAMRYITNTFVILLAALVIVGCVTTPQPRQAEFIESEFAPYGEIGSSTVTGQAFLKTRGGEVRFGAGSEVIMVPVTSYTTEIFQRSVLDGQRLQSPDSRYAAYRRTTTTDGNGNFEFRNAPAGEYYLSCVITWEVPGPYGLQTTGGTAHGRVKAGAGETVKVIVTR